ncbi:MAG: signal peptidase I [Ilumatobacteraceae bacterium]
MEERPESHGETDPTSIGADAGPQGSVSREPIMRAPATRDAVSRSAGWKQIREWVVVLVSAVLIALTLRTFVVQQFYIAGPSMETTLFGNDRVLVNKLSYRFGTPSRGDVVVFDRITMNGDTVQHDDLIKRVIGLPGETIEIRNCIVFIDDVPLGEPWLPAALREPASDADTRCGTPTVEPTVVGESEVYLIGDNRPMSFDSRMFGPVSIDLIVGRAVVVIWPPSNMSTL